MLTLQSDAYRVMHTGSQPWDKCGAALQPRTPRGVNSFLPKSILFLGKGSQPGRGVFPTLSRACLEANLIPLS